MLGRFFILFLSLYNKNAFIGEHAHAHVLNVDFPFIFSQKIHEAEFEKNIKNKD